MTERDSIRDIIHVPLSTALLTDIEFNDASPMAQLVYLRALPQAKVNARDGLVTVRQLAGGLIGHVTIDDVAELCAELVDLGLFDTGERPGTFLIAGWLKHNEPVENIEQARKAKRRRMVEGGHRTNHNKGQHDTQPHPDCPLCDVSPAQSGSDRPPTGTRSGPEPGPDRSEPDRPPTASDLDLDRNPYPDPYKTTTTTDSDTKRGSPDASGGGGRSSPTAILEDAMAALGYADPIAPETGEIRTLERALARGHPPDALVAVAWSPSIQNADKPRRALVGAWGNLGNRDPDPKAAGQRKPFDWDSWTPPEDREEAAA